VKGLKDFAPEDRPNSTLVFWSFRIMVGLGMLMLFLLSLVFGSEKGNLYEKVVSSLCINHGTFRLIALLAGWFTTEVGRQPWIIYGVMRTKMPFLLFRQNRLD
jgi:cytochrome d ubiquinol oxidase subunit I